MESKENKYLNIITGAAGAQSQGQQRFCPDAKRVFSLCVKTANSINGKHTYNKTDHKSIMHMLCIC